MFLKRMTLGVCIVASALVVSASHADNRGKTRASVKILHTQFAKEIAWVEKQMVRVEWFGANGKRYAANLTLRPYWRVAAEEHPIVKTWRMEGTHVLMLLVYASNSGTAEFCSPLFCRLTGSRCLPLNRDLEPYSFSNHGSFYLNGKRLYIWDAIHEGDDSSPKHRYKLRTFVWKDGRYHLICSQSTRRAYQPFVAGAGLGVKLDPTEDPLKEFGMRWHWGMLDHRLP